MIISKSPFRIAFAGGGTDIDEFSNLEGRGYKCHYKFRLLHIH